MIPETRGIHNKRYDFNDLDIESYLVLNDIKEANSYRTSARKRGYRIAIRSLNGEVRGYFLGKIIEKVGNK
jgi:hypothetical protein